VPARVRADPKRGCYSAGPHLPRALHQLARCPLYPQKRTLAERIGMSALCQTDIDECRFSGLLSQSPTAELTRCFQFGCSPTSFTTRCHRSVSSRMKAPKLSADVEIGNISCGSSWALTSGNARTALTSLFNRSMTGFGVPAVVLRPNHSDRALVRYDSRPTALLPIDEVSVQTRRANVWRGTEPPNSRRTGQP
jgi:hypothetical protein